MRRSWCVLALAVAVRALAAMALYGGGQMPIAYGGGDQGGYIDLARHVYDHRDMTHPLFVARPPALPVAAAALYSMVGEGEPFAVIALHIVGGALTCLIVYRLALALVLSQRVAFGVAVLTALEPSLVMGDVSFMTETLFVFLFTLAMLWGVYARARPTWQRGAVAGMLLSLAVLTRPTALAYPLVATALVGWRQWRCWLPLVLVFAMTVAGWTWHNVRVHGVPAYSTVGVWALVFSRALASESWATGADVDTLYARYARDIETRAGRDPDEALPFRAYLTPADGKTYAAMTALAWEKNAAYPRWYLAETVAGFIRLVLRPYGELIPATVHVFFNLVVFALAIRGAWRLGRSGAWFTLAQ